MSEQILTNKDFTIGQFMPIENFQVQKVIITRPCKYCQNGAIKVAEYIVNEMLKNKDCEFTKSMAEANRNANKLLFASVFVPAVSYQFPAALPKLRILWKFKEQIGYKKPWDHKPLISSNIELVNASLDYKGEKSRHYHKFRNADYFYDIWSNIHYGFIGLCCGFSEAELCYGAGLAQIKADGNYDIGKILSFDPNNWDNPEDQVAIKLGFDLYYDYLDTGLLTKEKLLIMLDDLPYYDGFNFFYKFKTRHFENCKNGIWTIPNVKK